MALLLLSLLGLLGSRLSVLAATDAQTTPPAPVGPYCVDGVVFNDVNENGRQDDPTVEPALAAFQVLIFPDRNNNEELDPADSPPLETITTDGGPYRSTELEAGTYFVTAEAPTADPPWVHTLPQGPVMLTFSGVGGDFCEEVNFGFKHVPAGPINAEYLTYLPLVRRSHRPNELTE